MRKATLFLLIATLILSVSACSTRRVKVQAPPAPEARCDDGPVACSGDCPPLPLWDLNQDGRGDFDVLARLGLEDQRMYDGCRAKLRACQACLQRLQDKGVIYWRAVPAASPDTIDPGKEQGNGNDDREGGG